jgi:protein-tyrosine phosphatase
MTASVPAGGAHVPIDGCVNFRDAGGWSLSDGSRMRTGTLYRSDDPIRLTPTGRVAVDALGLVAVFDVRAQVQVDRSPGFVDPDRTFVRPLVDRVIDVDNPPRLETPADLTALYESMIDATRPQLAEVLDLVAEHVGRGPVLIHCAFGKDRTGLLVAMIEATIGVPAEQVAEDYGRSHGPAQRRFAWMQDEPLPDDPPLWRSPPGMFTAPAEAMSILLERVAARHGSIDRWLDELPVAPDTPARLRAALVER